MDESMMEPSTQEDKVNDEHPTEPESSGGTFEFVVFEKVGSSMVQESKDEEASVGMEEKRDDKNTCSDEEPKGKDETMDESFMVDHGVGSATGTTAVEGVTIVSGTEPDQDELATLVEGDNKNADEEDTDSCDFSHSYFQRFEACLGKLMGHGSTNIDSHGDSNCSTKLTPVLEENNSADDGGNEAMKPIAALLDKVTAFFSAALYIFQGPSNLIAENKSKLLSITAVLCALFAVGAAPWTWARDSLADTKPAASTMAPPSPKQDLQSFVTLERDRNEMDALEDLHTEGFQRYARSACVSAGSLEQAKSALSIQLKGLPEDVRTLVIERALIEGITHRSTMQDSSSQLETHGRAQSYMAFWSTVYHPRALSTDDIQYETCVLVAGMEIGLTEIVADYKTEEKQVVVGSIPCECGYIYCAGTCPVFNKVVERTPIFQRSSLSLKQQDDLHRWLVKNAIDAAEALVGGESNPRVLSSNSEDEEVEVETLGWKKPPLKEAFYSEDP